MKRFSLIVLLSVIALSSFAGPEFIENKRQWDSEILFKSHLPSGALFLTRTALVYAFYSAEDMDALHELAHDGQNVDDKPVRHHAYKVHFAGANPNPVLLAEKQAPYYHNYFLGKDASRWSTHVNIFGQTMYQDLYPGIDLKIYGQDAHMKFDFIVEAGANPGLIQLNYEGVHPKLTPDGKLLIMTSVNSLTESKPYVYQLIHGVKKEVPSRYTLKGNVLGYEFPEGYDARYDLIIDPVLVFATYSGTSGTTYGFSATYDVSGSLYAGGQAFAAGWPSTAGAYQSTFGGMQDAGINKYTPTGNALIYGTYYGGSGADLPNNMVVNANNELVVFGSTTSSNLPVTAGCFDNSLGGSADLYVAHFNATGTGLIGATYVGGSGTDGQNSFTLSPNYGDRNRGEVYVDQGNNIVCASSTESNNFPVTAGCYQSTFGGMQDGCIFKLDQTCSNLLYSTYVGGSNEDACFAIVQNSKKHFIAVGGTMSTNFPVTANVIQNTFGGMRDGFALSMDSTLGTLIHSTYLGTADEDHAFKVQLDENEHVYVCGQSDGGNYPVTAGLYNNATGGIFIHQIDSSFASSIKSTVIGQPMSSGGFSQNLVPTAFLYDHCGNVYFSGFQASGTLPLSANAHQTTQGGFWLCVLSNGMQSLLYATYMGAAGDHVDGGTSRFDPEGIIYQSVCTASSNQYQSPGSWSPSNQASSWDVASFKFDFEAAGVNADVSLGIGNNDSLCTPAVVNFVNNTVNAVSYLWDFGDGTTSTLQNPPAHTYTTPGIYTIKLNAYNPTSCVTEDSAEVTIYIFQVEKPDLVVKDTVICDPNVQLNLTAQVNNLKPNMQFRWDPAAAVIGPNNTQTIQADASIATTFTVTVIDSIPNVCSEFSSGEIHVTLGDTTQMDVHPKDTTVCFGGTVAATAVGGVQYAWTPDYQISSTNSPNVLITAFSEVYYHVQITDANGCSATKHIRVNAYPLVKADAGPDEIIRFGESITLQASGGKNYQWFADPTLNNLNIPNPVATPVNEKTTYFVQVSTEQGCSAIDSVHIFLTNGIVPNAFSPNGDGKNDKFRFYPSNELINLNAMRVFDRWGKELFYTQEIEDSWDGNYKGTPCENGVYFYLVEYSIGGKSYTYKGDLTLLR
ncbi:MAG: gliding motility-associated C-terminal domain-containing protein [Chitinophagaceae bacterium]|nr:gliding motility-associated C-terminal domain-containing protein [Chitinophagaceae bacterium]